jgi:hypothetical protein
MTAGEAIIKPINNPFGITCIRINQIKIIISFRSCPFYNILPTPTEMPRWLQNVVLIWENPPDFFSSTSSDDYSETRSEGLLRRVTVKIA